MTYFPDLSPYQYSGQSRCGNYEVLNIGWLDGIHDFPKSTPDEKKLNQIKSLLEEARRIKFMMGKHLCEICGKEAGVGEFHAYNPHTKKIYAAPALIVHYIEDHRYAPPEEFIEAVFHKILEKGYCGNLQAMELVEWGYDEQEAIKIIHNTLGIQVDKE